MNQLVQPTTGFLINIVNEKSQKNGFGMKVNISYLADYQVLIFTIERWFKIHEMNFSIKRALYVEDLLSASHLSEHIKEMCFDDYNNECPESDLTNKIIDFIRNQIEP